MKWHFILSKNRLGEDELKLINTDAETWYEITKTTSRSTGETLHHSVIFYGPQSYNASLPYHIYFTGNQDQCKEYMFQLALYLESLDLRELGDVIKYDPDEDPDLHELLNPDKVAIDPVTGLVRGGVRLENDDAVL